MNKFEHKCVSCGTRYPLAQICDWCELRTIPDPLATRRATDADEESAGGVTVAGMTWALIVVASLVAVAVSLFH